MSLNDARPSNLLVRGEATGLEGGGGGGGGCSMPCRPAFHLPRSHSDEIVKRPTQ